MQEEHNRNKHKLPRRDYSLSLAANKNNRPESSEVNLRTRQAPKLGRAKKYGALVITVLIVSGAVGLAILFYAVRSNTGSIPGNYKSQLKFPAYYPRQLPSGYTVDESSFEVKDGSLLFNLRGEDGKNIPVSEQIPPKGFNVAAGTNPVIFYTPVGQANITLFTQTTRVAQILADGKTLIIVVVNGISTPKAQDIARAFVKD